MHGKNIVRFLSCLAVGLAATVALSAGSSKTVDDLEGLRPDTEGVETNKFWDTRAHAAFTVKYDGGASTNAFATAVLTRAVSTVGPIGNQRSFAVIIR